MVKFQHLAASLNSYLKNVSPESRRVSHVAPAGEEARAVGSHLGSLEDFQGGFFTYTKDTLQDHKLHHVSPLLKGLPGFPVSPWVKGIVLLKALIKLCTIWPSWLVWLHLLFPSDCSMSSLLFLEQSRHALFPQMSRSLILTFFNWLKVIFPKDP